MSLGHHRRKRGRGGNVAHFPPGQGEAFPGTANTQAALPHVRQGHKGEMGGIEGQVLIDFVTDGIGIVLLQQFRDERQFIVGEHFAGGVHGGVEENRLGAGGKGLRQCLPGQGPAGMFQPHDTGTPPSWRTIGR